MLRPGGSFLRRGRKLPLVWRHPGAKSAFDRSRLIIPSMGNSPREWNDGSAVRLDRQDPYLRLQSVMIFVRDLEQSLSFYLDQLDRKSTRLNSSHRCI